MQTNYESCKKYKQTVYDEMISFQIGVLCPEESQQKKREFHSYLSPLVQIVRFSFLIGVNSIGATFQPMKPVSARH